MTTLQLSYFVGYMCMYIYTYVHTGVDQVYVYRHMHVCLCIHICTTLPIISLHLYYILFIRFYDIYISYICIYMYIYICIYISQYRSNICMRYIYIYICMYVCIYDVCAVCVCVCIINIFFTLSIMFTSYILQIYGIFFFFFLYIYTRIFLGKGRGKKLFKNLPKSRIHMRVHACVLSVTKALRNLS